MPASLRDLTFVDLYFGEGYVAVKTAPGAHAPGAPLPAEYAAEADQVRARCAALHAELDEPQFALHHDGVLYRVTVMDDLHAKPLYFIRRVAATVRPFATLGLPPHVAELVLRPATRGLILIVGETTVGKTSTAASLLSARLSLHGGFAIAIGDPPEPMLHGLHGKGRCFQVPATRRNGGYGEQLRSALRSGVSDLLIGEIRDRASASEAIKHSINGLTVISTLHAKDVGDAVHRILMYAGTDDVADPAGILASGLTCIIHQRMERAEDDSVRVLFSTLTITGSEAPSIRTHIREGRSDQLAHIVDTQARRHTWAP